MIGTNGEFEYTAFTPLEKAVELSTSDCAAARCAFNAGQPLAPGFAAQSDSFCWSDAADAENWESSAAFCAAAASFVNAGLNPILPSVPVVLTLKNGHDCVEMYGTATLTDNRLAMPVSPQKYQA